MATTSIAAFPSAAVRSALTAELIELVKSQAFVKGLPLPRSSAEAARAAVEVDSLAVVAALCAVEPHLGFEVPQSVVRAGGYGSADEALQHLLPRLEREWLKRHGGVQ